MKNPKIPRGLSVEELAAFWDTHTVTVFEDELEETTGAFATRDDALTVRLQPRQAQELRKIAKSKGIDTGALVRRWVQERIRQESKAK